MQLQLTTMKCVTYLIVGLYSTKWFAPCLGDSKSEKSHDVATSRKFEIDEIIQLKNSSLLSNFENLRDVEPLISDPVFEDSPWNISAPKEYSGKRDVQESGLSHEVKMEILQLHNIYRSNVTPPAANMNFMEWDDELARLAQMWADGCVFEHGMPDNDYPGTVGQNLYSGYDPTGYLGLWMWYEEYLNYDLRKQICLPGKQCGHYVQMAWAESHKLGCGMTKCGSRYFLACHYTPQALRGVQMFRVAKPCSQCSSKNGALCLKNLCLSWDQCKRNPFYCQFARCEMECLNCGRLDQENCLCECADGWDSPDCSHLCSNQHRMCGRNPGFPSIASCSLNNFAVGNEYCRKMCEMCTPLDEQLSTHTCCNGTLCDQGYVLETDEKSCKCSLLCPGPICDSKEKGVLQASLERSSAQLSVAYSFLALWIITIFYVYKESKIN